MKSLKWVVLVLVVALLLEFTPWTEGIACFLAGVLLSGPVTRAWERI